MKIQTLLLSCLVAMPAVGVESPSEADLRECLRPALHPTMTADELKKVLETATGPDGEASLRVAYGTNTLSAALLAGDQDIRVLHSMDFKPGTFSSTNLLQNLRHPCDEADVQLVDRFFSEKEGVASGLVSLERTNTYRAICLFVATRTGGQGPWTLEFLGLANRSSPALVYAHAVYTRDDSWSCFFRSGNWGERRARLAKVGLSERVTRSGMSAGAYMQSSLLKSIILEWVRRPFLLDYRLYEKVPAESWAQKMSRFEKEVTRASGKRITFFLSPNLASEVIPQYDGGRMLGGNFHKISVYDALNLMCEDQGLHYILTENGIHLSFAPGRERKPDPVPEPKSAFDDFLFPGEEIP
ncbi:MAG: hypothetical protein U1F77_03710 [Kiritimatiellia bacterium]